MTGKRNTNTPKRRNANTPPNPPPEPIVLPVTIAANLQRKALILTANKTNQDVIWLGGEENIGTPLEPGERINLKSDQAIDVLGKAGDWLYVAELTIGG